jgi:hypothetical protein
MAIQIIDPLMARSVQADAERRHPLFAWIIMRGLPGYAGAVIARLTTDAPTAYMMVGHTVAEVRAKLPPGLERSDRQPSDPEAIVEIWFPTVQ